MCKFQGHFLRNFMSVVLLISVGASGYAGSQNAVNRDTTSSVIRGKLEMLRAKLCNIFSRYGSLFNSQWKSKKALDELARISSFLSLVSIPEGQSNEIRDNPQSFIDGIASRCDTDVCCLKITNGSVISSSMYPNFFKTLYCSNQRPVYAGRLSTNDDKVIKEMSDLFAGKAPIRREEVDALLKNGELKNPSGVILYVIDDDLVFLAAKRTDISTDEEIVPLAQQASKWYQQSKDIRRATQSAMSKIAKVGAKGIEYGAEYVPDVLERMNDTLEYAENAEKIVAAVNTASNALTGSSLLSSIGETLGAINTSLEPVGAVVGPISTALSVISAAHLDEFAKKIPQVLYPGGDSELTRFVTIHAKTAIAFADLEVSDVSSDSIAREKVAKVSNCIHFDEISHDDWKSDLLTHPQEVSFQIAIDTGKNVCCLFVTSGRVICPNFFQTLYYFQHKPNFGLPVLEVVGARGITDYRVCGALREKCAIEKLRRSKELGEAETLIFVVDDALQKVYQVVYDPERAPKHPNIFTPEEWENWKRIIGPNTSERASDIGYLGKSTAKNAIRDIPFVGRKLVPHEQLGIPKFKLPEFPKQSSLEEPGAMSDAPEKKDPMISRI